MSASSLDKRFGKTLRELANGGLSTTSTLDILANDAIVPKFRDDFRLLPHQVIARAWMKEREFASTKGGILADDMGLGKTIETLVRIVEGPPSSDHLQTSDGGRTLIICPVDLMPQWVVEIQKFVPSFRIIKHHGTNRSSNPVDLHRPDIILTSYSTAVSEFSALHAPESRKGKPSKSPKTALFCVNWWRIVLDEAHNIKNHNTKTALACYELKAIHRWCLTGTPIQNSTDDIFSLLKFLRIPPLDNWSTYNTQVRKPIEAGESDSGLQRLHVVLRAVMLRRRLDHNLNGHAIVELPERTVHQVQCQFDSSEREFYDALELKIELRIEDLIQRQMVEKSLASILSLLLRLRQACDHPQLMFTTKRVDSSQTAETQPISDHINETFEHTADDHCSICGIGLNGTNLFPFSDTICGGCVFDVFPTEASRTAIASNTPVSSAKIRKIMELLHVIKVRSGGSDKTIIFSMFTKMLDLIQPFLRAEEFSYIRYDGDMKPIDRAKALASLRDDPSIQCALISVKSGGTGLNLTSCNNVILVDLWWNPAVEEQAFARAHRLGQSKTVNVYKLTVPDTVEDRILQLQSKKEALAKAALDKDQITKMKLNLGELMSLFRMRGDVI